MRINFKFGIVLNPIGNFGGAQRRFTNLFYYFTIHFPENAYFFISHDLLEKIKILYPNYPIENLIPFGNMVKSQNSSKGVFSAKNKSVVSKTSKDIFFLKKLYKFLKSFYCEFKHFKEIEKKRKELGITVLMGVFSGILPLYFYLKKKKRDVGVIFCNMDSWFSDVLPDEKKYWYRKYSSFNYALENSDYIDFLSPFILEGIRDRGIKVRDESVSITPCSFTDYSKCKVGDKSIFQVAFSGRLEKDKNPDLFVEAAAILSKKYPEIVFHIMGEGRLTSDIKEKITQGGLSNIKFYGFHPQPTEILADTSVFISIQNTNNYPSQSVLEAMGCGNAIIATDVGDTRMFINDRNGILINLKTEELVNAIESLYQNKELCKKMGDYAYKYVRENHTVERMAEYYTELFRKTNLKIISK